MSLKLRHKLMKSGGSIRILVPKAICEQLNLKEGDTLLIWLENGKIVMEKEEKELKPKK